MQEKRQENMTYKWIFAILKIEMLKTCFSPVKIIKCRLVIKATLNRKISSSSANGFHNKAPQV